METPLMALRFGRRDFLEIFFAFRVRVLVARCKPFVSAASCRTRTFRKAILIQSVIQGTSIFPCQLPLRPATDWWPKRLACLGGYGLKRAEPGCPMNDICAFTRRPLAFLAHYIKGRGAAHGVILASVLGAVISSIGAQYGVKMLVDSLAGDSVVWLAFATLASLIAADNLLWRLAMYIGSFTF